MFSNAQKLPKPSPGAELEQMVGATEIEIEYSRPGVKDRVIFGELVPYGEVWRFGANSATTFSNEHSLFFETGELKAGKYAVFAIPNKDSWEVIFNTDTKAGAEEYTQDKDALRIKVNVVENSFTETFTLGFDKLRDESASFVALWENVKVEVPFTLKTKEDALSNINKAVAKGKDLKSVYSNAANYYYGTLKDYKTALDYVEKSINEEKDFGNLFLKSRILFESGKKDEAIKLAKTAYELSLTTASIGYQNFISGTIARWSK